MVIIILHSMIFQRTFQGLNYLLSELCKSRNKCKGQKSARVQVLALCAVCVIYRYIFVSICVCAIVVKYILNWILEVKTYFIKVD